MNNSVNCVDPEGKMVLGCLLLGASAAYVTYHLLEAVHEHNVATNLVIYGMSYAAEGIIDIGLILRLSRLSLKLAVRLE